MKKSVKKGIGLVGIMALSLFGGVMTSYAIGPGEVSQTVAMPVTYNQQAVKSLGSWEAQSSGTWKFKCLDGSYLANSWIESLSEAGAYYFVGADGIMLLNSKTPDGYTVDGSGLWRSGVAKEGTSSNNSSYESRIGNTQNKSSSDDELSPELLEAIKRNAGASAYGGLH